MNETIYSLWENECDILSPTLMLALIEMVLVCVQVAVTGYHKLDGLNLFYSSGGWEVQF